MMMTTRMFGRNRPWAAASLAALLWLGCGDDPPPAAPDPPAPRDASSVTGDPTQTLDAAAAADRPVAVDVGVDGPAADASASGDGLPGPDGPAPVSMINLYEVPPAIVAACQRYAEAQCARWKECVPDRFAADYNSDEICRLRREAACRTDFVVAGRAEVATDRQACTQAILAQSCRDVFFSRRMPACDAPPGTLMLGQACFRGSQCGRGLTCQVEVDSCGTCQPTLAVGGDCGWWAGGCPLGTTCYDDRCLPTLKVAEACKTSSAPCEPGLECLAQGCVEKTADLGASCAAGDLCDPVKGLYCNFTTGLCERVPGPVPIGERCDTFNAEGAPLDCGPDGSCFSESTGVGAVRRCVARADLGQPCDPAMGRSCKVPAACSRGVCVTPTVVNGGTYLPPMCR